MLLVGLTGGIASGKSTVSRLLSEKHKVPIIDADQLARDVVAPNTPGYKSIVSHFGADKVLKPDGITLDRQALGEIIFDNEKERKVLNGIIHPAVRWEMVKRVMRAWMRGEWVVVLDIPLLIETGIYHWVAKVVVVYLPEPLQIARLRSRPSPDPSTPLLSQSQALSRIRSQLPLISKTPYADHVLDNSGSPGDLEQQVDVLVKRWRDRYDTWFWRWAMMIPPLGLLVGGTSLYFRLMNDWGRKNTEKRRKQRLEQEQRRYGTIEDEGDSEEEERT